jgi:hypothetical protein
MAADTLSSVARWHAIVYYRTGDGLLDVEMTLGEIRDLHERIELGPHWDTIELIEIRRANHIDDAKLVFEQVKRS